MKNSKHHLRFYIYQPEFWLWNIFLKSSGYCKYSQRNYIYYICVHNIKDRGDVAFVHLDWHRLHSDNDTWGHSSIVLRNELCDSPVTWLTSSKALRKLLYSTKTLFPYILMAYPHEITVKIQINNVRMVLKYCGRIACFYMIYYFIKTLKSLISSLIWRYSDMEVPERLLYSTATSPRMFARNYHLFQVRVNDYTTHHCKL